MKTTDDVVEISLFDANGEKVGMGRIWKARPNHWSWAHPNGSEGCDEKSFRAAEDALKEASKA